MIYLFSHGKNSGKTLTLNLEYQGITKLIIDKKKQENFRGRYSR